jgi:hypothetical protein
MILLKKHYHDFDQMAISSLQTQKIITLNSLA